MPFGLLSFFRRFLMSVRGVSVMITQLASSEDPRQAFENVMNKVDSRLRDADHKLFYISSGLALTKWALIEERIVIIVTLLLGTQPKKAGLVLYNIVNFGTWIMIVSDLFDSDKHFSKHLPRWNKLTNRLRKMKDTRDRLAHHPIIFNTGNTVFSLPANLDNRSKSKKMTPLTSNEVDNFVEELTILFGDLNNFIECLLCDAEKLAEDFHDNAKSKSEHPDLGTS